MDIKENPAALRLAMNRISAVYTDIPKIIPEEQDGGRSRKDALDEFSRIFSVSGPDKLFEKIAAVYHSIKRLCRTELSSEITSETFGVCSRPLRYGDTGSCVFAAQHMLSAVLLFHGIFMPLEVTGDFDADTENAVNAFRRIYGLPQTGIIDGDARDYLIRSYRGIAAVIPPFCSAVNALPFSGQLLREGMSGNDVEQLQIYLNNIRSEFPEIPKVAVTGRFGPLTARAVREAQKILGIPQTGAAGINTWNGIAEIYSDLLAGSAAADGQFPGYTLKQ